MHKGTKVDVNFYGMRICVAGARSVDEAYQKLCNALAAAGITEFETDRFQVFVGDQEREDRASVDVLPKDFDEAVVVTCNRVYDSEDATSDSQIEIDRLDMLNTIRDLRRGVYSGNPNLEVAYLAAGEWEITVYGGSNIAAEHLVEDAVEKLGWAASAIITH